MGRPTHRRGPGVALIRTRLKAAEVNDCQRVKQWLDDLGSDDFATREAAVRELGKLGDRIEGLLVKGMSGRPSLEAKRRIEALLAKLDTPTPERLARSRALETLEQIATPDAVNLLEALAGGEPDARLTREAAAVLNRGRKQ